MSDLKKSVILGEGGEEESFFGLVTCSKRTEEVVVPGPSGARIVRDLLAFLALPG